MQPRIEGGEHGARLQFVFAEAAAVELRGPAARLMQYQGACGAIPELLRAVQVKMITPGSEPAPLEDGSAEVALAVEGPFVDQAQGESAIEPFVVYDADALPQRID